MQHQEQAALHQAPSMTDPEQVAGNLMQRPFPDQEAARRMSAPAAPPGVPPKVQSYSGNVQLVSVTL